MPVRRFSAVCLLLAIVLTAAGCQRAWRAQFPQGSVLYNRTDHSLFGKVVGYEEVHDFHNGTMAEPAILIEQEGDHAAVWGSCATCAAMFDIKAP